MNRLGITAVAALFAAFPLVSPIATADPAGSTSPGVPCLDIVEQLAASPSTIQQPLESALVDAVGGVPPSAPPVGALPAPPMIPTGPLPGPPPVPVGALPAPPMIPTGPLPGPPPVPAEAAPVTEAAAEVAALVADDSVVAAPIVDSAGVVPSAPVPVVPDIGSLGSLATSALPVPSVPGLPIPLPQAVSLPHDLICEGTAWSASKLNAQSPTLGRALANRRDW
jgi:hypothetical protein